MKSKYESIEDRRYAAVNRVSDLHSTGKLTKDDMEMANFVLRSLLVEVFIDIAESLKEIRNG